MDAASLFCNRGRKVIWCHRGELGWFAPNLGAQAIGAGYVCEIYLAGQGQITGKSANAD